MKSINAKKIYTHCTTTTYHRVSVIFTSYNSVNTICVFIDRRTKTDRKKKSKVISSLFYFLYITYTNRKWAKNTWPVHKLILCIFPCIIIFTHCKKTQSVYMLVLGKIIHCNVHDQHLTLCLFFLTVYMYTCQIQ